MKSTLLWPVVVSTVLATLLAIGLTLVLSPSAAELAQSECARQQDDCESDCRWQAQRDLYDLQFERSREYLEYGQRMTQCTIMPDVTAREACRAEENARYATVVAGLDAKAAAIQSALEGCETQCAFAANECEQLESLADALAWRKLKRELLGPKRPGVDPIAPRDG